MIEAMTRLEISIVLPFLNKEVNIERLDGALSKEKSHVDVEIIQVIDGSK